MNQPLNIRLIDNRSCGDCFACCKILNIHSETLHKAADVLCPNYQHGEGCSIYDQRPEQCRQWYCLWRLEEALPDDYRPDKSNIVFCPEKNPRDSGKIIIVARAYEVEHDIVFSSPSAHRTFDLLMAAGYDVWLSNGVLKAPIKNGEPLPRFKLDEYPLDKKPETPRNALCSCGSGRRYKNCCGKI